MKRHTSAPVLVVLSLGIFAAVCHAEDRVRIVNEGGIRDQWMLADGIQLAAPGYPAAFAERGDNVCVAIGYAIQPNGSTSDFAVLKSWSSSTGEKEPQAGFWDAFVQASAGALSQWRFKPRPEVTSPQPTYTVATMHFMGRQAADVGELRSHCQVADLATLVKKNNAARSMIGAREKSELERWRRSQEANKSMVQNPARGY